MDKLFIAVPPGLVRLALEEAVALELVSKEESERLLATEGQLTGGFEISGGLAEIQRANLHLRTASRVLLRLGAFYAKDFETLKQNIGRLPWQRYFTNGTSLAARAESEGSLLYHEGAVEHTVVEALIQRAGMLGLTVHEPQPGTEPDQRILIRIVRNRCTISLDTSGELLNRRGYRQALAKAPLRETLAAGMVLASGWDRRSPLVDPFCGSGTIPIEAAMLANQIAPGLRRSFAFQQWPIHDPAAWQSLTAQANDAVRATGTQILGQDRDAGAVAFSQQNAERAGVSALVHFNRQAISDLPKLPGTGWVVTNPPYGERVSPGNDLRNLYARFGEVLRSNCRGWHYAILCSDEALFRQTRLTVDSALALNNGGIAVKCYTGKIP